MTAFKHIINRCNEILLQEANIIETKGHLIKHQRNPSNDDKSCYVLSKEPTNAGNVAMDYWTYNL